MHTQISRKPVIYWIYDVSEIYVNLLSSVYAYTDYSIKTMLSIFKIAVTNMEIDNIHKQHTQRVLLGVNKSLQMTSKRDPVVKRAKML